MEEGPRIPEKLFFRIGEVCELIKVQPHVLRYWETEFSMLAPQKNKAGQRVYRRKDVEMVFRIRDLLYEQKFTIAGAKKKLQEESRPGVTPGRAKAPTHKSEPERESAAQQQPLEAETPKSQPSDLLPGIAVPSPGTPSPATPRKGTHASSTHSAPKSSPPAEQPSSEKHEKKASEKTDETLSASEKRVLRLIKTDLEDLLTRLNSDVTLKR